MSPDAPPPDSKSHASSHFLDSPSPQPAAIPIHPIIAPCCKELFASLAFPCDVILVLSLHSPLYAHMSHNVMTRSLTSPVLLRDSAARALDSRHPILRAGMEKLYGQHPPFLIQAPGSDPFPARLLWR